MIKMIGLNNCFISDGFVKRLPFASNNLTHKENIISLLDIVVRSLVPLNTLF